MHIRKTNSVALTDQCQRGTPKPGPFPFSDQQVETPDHISSSLFTSLPSLPLPSLFLYCPPPCLVTMRMLLLVVQAKAVPHHALAPLTLAIREQMLVSTCSKYQLAPAAACGSLFRTYVPMGL